MNTIRFSFEDKSIESKTVQAEEGFSILEIAEMNNIHLNHNCGGVCACSTCHIYVNEGMDFLEEITDKEEDFIDRAINPKLESRLACQSVIISNKSSIDITIPDQSKIIGHEH